MPFFVGDQQFITQNGSLCRILGKNGKQNLVVKDWTNNVNDFQPYNMSRLKSKWENSWLSNFEENKNVMELETSKMVPYYGKIREGETAYIVGNGPSLRQDIELLKGKKRNVFMTNRADDLIERGLDCEFYMTIDAGPKYGERELKWGDLASKSGATGIFSIFAEPRIVKKFKNKMFFNVWGRGSKLWQGWEDYAKERWNDGHEHTSFEGKKETFYGCVLDSGYNVMFSMLHLVYRMGYKKVVLLGQDHAFSGGYDYFNDEEPFIFIDEKTGGHALNKKVLKKYTDRSIDVFKTKDIHGETTFTTRVMQDTAKFFSAACQFLNKEIEIVNCSNEGILEGPGIIQDRLVNHV